MLGRAVAGFEHARQKIVEGIRCLKVAQSGRIGRRHVDREIGREIGEGFDACHIIGGAVGRVFIGAEIDAERRARAGMLHEPLMDLGVTFIVEAEAVDRCRVGYETKQTRARITALRARRHGADFDKSEAEPGHMLRDVRVLIETRGEAEGIAEGKTEGFGRKAGIIQPGCRFWQKPQRFDRQVMRSLGVQTEQQGFRQSR